MRFVWLRALYRRYFQESRRERLFLASLTFFLTFAITRTITSATRAHTFFHIAIGDTHVHHLVWGIMLLLLAGYLALIQVGRDESTRTAQRMIAVLYGVGAALTLDEFALWLNLEDVYWETRGRASVDAVMLFGALISLGFWGGPFLRAVWRLMTRVRRRQAKHARIEHPPA
jgi:hypothetical protein